jgi:hypothetical protein
MMTFSFFFLKIYLFIICKYTVRHSRRGCQILLQMVVVSHHVVAGIWTPDLRKSSRVLLPTEPSHQPRWWHFQSTGLVDKGAQNTKLIFRALCTFCNLRGWFKKKKKPLCVCMVCVYLCMVWYIHKSQRIICTSQVFFSTMWVSGIKLRSGLKTSSIASWAILLAKDILYFLFLM